MKSLMSFSSFKGEMSDIKISQTMTQPDKSEMKVEASLISGTFEGTGVVGANGGVDNTVSVSFNGSSETFTTPAGEGMPAMPITITGESFTEQGKVDGLRPDAVYKTLAWFVAHPSTDDKEADKATLKGILQDGLPLFSMISVTGSAKNVAVTTPMGNVAIDEVGFGVDLNGLVADGKVRESISISGLTLPAGVVPEWAASILPKKASFDFQVTDFDAAAAATIALGLFDLPKGEKPDAAFEANLLAALLPNKTVSIGMNPGAISGEGYELTYTGSMVAGPEMPVPTGMATITLTGLDKLQAALANAPDDIKGQAMMGMGMAQGMAKPGENGALVWEIDASKPGSLSVNGTPLMGGN